MASPPSAPPASPDPALHALSRRRFLRWGSAAVVSGSALWGGLRLVAGSTPDVQGLQALGARHHAVLHALCRTLFPAGPVVEDPAAFATALSREGDTRLARMPDYLRQQLLAALLYVEAGPVLLEGRLRTFSRLDDAARAIHWRRHWEDTDDDLRRGAGVGLRRVIGLWAYDIPSLWPAMHYPGPLLEPMPQD